MTSTSITGTVKVELSPEDRRLIKLLLKQMGVTDEEMDAAVSTTTRLVEQDDAVDRIIERAASRWAGPYDG